MQLRTYILAVLLFLRIVCYAQKTDFTHQDTLRGTITPERAWWDVTYYHLNVEVDVLKHTIKGSNLIEYKVLEHCQMLQIELQEPLVISKIIQGHQELTFWKDGYSYFVELRQPQISGAINKLIVYYEGKPQESKNPPWSGGLTWKKTSENNDWVVTTCQGDGASLWWPNKDHAYDEPDSMLISITVPEHLMDVSNGVLRSIEKKGKKKTYHWFVSNPINNYGVNMNLGVYAHFNTVYKGLLGELSCDFYVLRENLEKARLHFKESKRMLDAFEYWFGPYPFYEDGYKLVEVPYAGMEHQSSITYGNGFENGYLGRDVSGTGWGMKFDFIIVHESGHEWFANSITHKDVADMWIHEGFTSYSENLFVDYHFGEEACNEYVQGVRKNILNDRPIIGVYDVHHEGSGDMYYKCANVLHTLRQLVDDDEKWRSILNGLNKQFYHQTVTTRQIENYLMERTGLNLRDFFDQYLRTVKVPALEYVRIGERIKFRYKNVVKGYTVPLRIYLNNQPIWIYPTEVWSFYDFDLENALVTFDKNFYIDYIEVSN